MKNNVKKVPVILQMEALECGAASLAMILSYYKKYIPLEQLRLDCNVSRDGSTAKYICLAARYHGLEAKGYKMSVEKLKNETDFPVIIHWNFNHFVVLCGFRGNKAVINDPASGNCQVDMEEFDRSFTGVVLKFSPSDSFIPEGKPQSTMGFLKKRLVENKAAFVLILGLGLILAILELIKPVFYKIFTDQVLIANATEWMSVIVAGMLLILGFGCTAMVLRSILLAKVQAKMCISSSAGFMWHVLRLPVEFFSQRFTGDIVLRQQSNNEIAFAVCNRFAPVFLNLVMMGIYMLFMLYYDMKMALVGIVMAFLNLILMNIITKKNASIAKSIQRDSGKVAGIEVAAISMIETIKASGAEFGFFEKIAGYKAKYNNALNDFRRRNVILAVIPEVLAGISYGIILIWGVFYIFNGRFTIGALMAFQSFMNLFLCPVNELSATIEAFQEITGNIERVEDVMHYQTDVKKIPFDSELTEYNKLTGKVEVKDLVFGYSTLGPALIQKFNLSVEPGKMVALVGGSGSGKSTLAKVISGLYIPRSGAVLFDGRSMKEINRYVFTNSLSVVDQSISMFEGTIRENITMWDTEVLEEELITACKDACIYDDVMKLPEGFDSIVAEGGSNFSGGQRQRFEIARSFVMNPSILILDEATSALDPMTEKKIMDAVKRRNITCFVIAHRLSTIRDADEIIMLEYGEVVERGRHSELLALDGKYAKLVKSE